MRDPDDPDGFQTTDLDGDGEPEILVLGNNADRFDDDDTVGIFHWDPATGTYLELFDHFPFVTLAHHHGKLQIVGRTRASTTSSRGSRPRPCACSSTRPERR